MTTQLNFEKQSVHAAGYCQTLNPETNQKSSFSQTVTAAKATGLFFLNRLFAGKPPKRLPIPSFETPIELLAKEQLTPELIKTVKEYGNFIANLSEKKGKSKQRKFPIPSFFLSIHSKKKPLPMKPKHKEIDYINDLETHFRNRIDELIKSGADINSIIDQDKNTLLHLAASLDHPDMIHLLIEFGADLYKKNKTVLGGYTPLELARAADNTKAVKALEKVIRQVISIRTEVIESKKLSQDLRSHKLGKYFIPQSIQEKGITPLHVAIMKNDTTEAIRLIESHPEYVSALTDLGFTALHFAAQYGNCEVAQKIIDLGVDINQGDNEGRTALHYAVMHSKSEMISLLKKNHAGFDIQDNDGETPLHFAAFTEQKQYVELLLKMGASADIKNREGKTPLTSALLVSEDATSNIQATILNEMHFNPYFDFTKNALKTLSYAFITRAAFTLESVQHIFSSFPTMTNPTLIGGVSSWIMISSAINTILCSHYKTAHIPYFSRRISSEAFAGAVLLSAAYFSGNIGLIGEIGRTMIGAFAVELLIRQGLPLVSKFCTNLWQRSFHEIPSPLFQDPHND